MSTGAAVGKTEVFLNRHIGGRSFHRVLKEMTDHIGPLMFFGEGHILTIDKDASLIWLIRTGNHVQKRRFTSAVAADDGHKITIIKMQIQMG